MSEILGRLTGASHIQGKSTEDVEHVAAIYALTSTGSQMFGHSLEEQVRQCVQRCEVLGWTVGYVFRDGGESGKDTDRPMFQRMLSRAEQGAFDVLVFWALDRFSRSIMHAVRLESDFRDWGVALHSVTEQLDTTTPAGRFNFRNLANAAEFEREMIRQRTKMGHAARAVEGKWPNGSPPLGYEVDQSGRLRVLDTEATFVRGIFHRYLESRSMRRVAQQLDSKKTPGPRSPNWTASTVGRILCNSLYVGEYRIGTTVRSVPEYRIVPEQVYDRARAIRHRFRGGSDAKRPTMNRQAKENHTKAVLGQYERWLNYS